MINNKNGAEPSSRFRPPFSCANVFSAVLSGSSPPSAVRCSLMVIR